MLWSARRFIGASLSAVIIVGLSGRWDRYLLDFLFDLAKERRLLIVDVKPSARDGKSLVDSFRATFYPSIPQALDVPDSKQVSFIPISMTADKFTEALGGALAPIAQNDLVSLLSRGRP